MSEPDTIRAAGTLDLTVHVRDPTVPPKIRIPERQPGRRQRVIVQVAMEADGHAGATVCGRTLKLDELWVPHTPEDIDPRCRACFAGETEPTDELLWTPVGDEEEWPEDDTPPARPVHTVKVAGEVL